MIATTFAEEVKALPGGEALEMCYSCGTCTSKCMIQLKQEPEYNPRRLLRTGDDGMRPEAYTNPHHVALLSLRPVLPGLPAANSHLRRHHRSQANCDAKRK